MTKELCRYFFFSLLFEFNVIMSARKVLINISSDRLLNSTRIFFLLCNFDCSWKVLMCNKLFGVNMGFSGCRFFMILNYLFFQTFFFSHLRKEKYFFLFIAGLSDRFLFIRSGDEREGNKIAEDMQVKGFLHYSNVCKSEAPSNDE